MSDNQYDPFDDLTTNTPINADDTDALRTTRMPDSNLFYSRPTKRELIADVKKTSLTRLIPELPPLNTDLHIISNGAGAERYNGINPDAFDFGGFIPHLLSFMGSAADVYISTWAMNRNHAQSLLDQVHSGVIKRLTLLSDPYFISRQASVANYFVEELQKIGRPHRFLAFKNHAKILCVSDGVSYATVVGSANLSSQPRCENYVMSSSPELYQFYVHEFFEAMLK